MVISIRFSKPTLCYREALGFPCAVVIANAHHVLRIDVAEVGKFSFWGYPFAFCIGAHNSLVLMV